MRFSEEWIENLLLPLTAAITLLLDLADTFNWFNFFPNGGTSTLILLLSAMTISTLAIIQRQLIKLREQLQRLQTQKRLESLERIPEEIDPALRSVLQDGYFQEIIEFLHEAVNEGQSPVHDETRFRYYFANMLKNYARCTFLFICPMSFCSFWQDPSTERATNSFLRTGGKLKLVLIAQDAQEMASSTAPLTLKSLQQQNVQYYVVNGVSLPADLKKFCIVEHGGKVAWELTRTSGGNVEESTLTADKRKISAHIRAFEKLWDGDLQQKRKGI